MAPYDRVPSLALRWRPAPWGGALEGWRLSTDAELTQFRTDRTPVVWDGVSAGEQRSDVNGTRTLGVLRLSRRWETPGWFVEPSVQLHARHYRFEQALGDGRRSASLATSETPRASRNGRNGAIARTKTQSEVVGGRPCNR